MWWLPSLLMGCSETCPTPASELNEHEWTVFIQAVEYEIDNPELFPAETTPGNGTHTWRIEWLSPELVENDPTGDVEVYVDEQPFEGKGFWSNRECGNFSITFAGGYLAPDGVTQHNFAAGALLALYSDKLEGFLEWEETWRAPSDDIGTYTAKAQVFGELK